MEAIDVKADTLSGERAERMSHQERQDRRRLIATAVQNGMTHSAAADAFNVSVYTVQRACADHGTASPRRAGRPRTNHPDRALGIVGALCSPGYRSLEDIAQRFDVSKTYVANLRDRAAAKGIPVHLPDGKTADFLPE